MRVHDTELKDTSHYAGLYHCRHIECTSTSHIDDTFMCAAAENLHLDDLRVAGGWGLVSA